MRIGTYIGMFSQIKKNIQSFCTTYLRKKKPLQVLKNIHYDSSYDDTEDVHSNRSPYCNDENSPKNMDLNSEKQQFSDLNSNTRKNERKNRTKICMMYVDLHGIILVLNRYALNQIGRAHV